MVDRIRNVANQQEMEKTVDDFITMGYSIKSRGQDSVLLVKKEYGSLGQHILIALVTCWWTFFIGNIIFLLYKYFTSPEVLVKVDDDAYGVQNQGQYQPQQTPNQPQQNTYQPQQNTYQSQQDQNQTQEINQNQSNQDDNQPKQY